MDTVNGKLYRHFKGGLYQVLCIAKDCETGEEMVIYQALYGQYEIYSRPKKNFFEQLDRNRYPESPQLYRFEEVLRSDLSDIKDTADTGKKEHESFKTDATVPVSEEEQPLIIRFLEADSSEAKLQIIKQNMGLFDEKTVNNIEASLDIVSDSNDIDSRLSYICDVLRTKAKYESNRLR